MFCTFFLVALFLDLSTGSVPKLEIICERNCPPACKYPVYGQRTQVSVKCVESCKGIDENKYKWTFEGTPDDGSKLFTHDFDYNKFTITGRYGPRFVLHESAGQNTTVVYTISVEIDDAKFPKVQVEQKKLRYQHFDMMGCIINPDHGISLETNFSIFCLPEDVNDTTPTRYQLFCGDNFVIDGKSPEVFNETFVLPGNCSVIYYKYISDKGVSGEGVVPNVNITDRFAESKPEKARKDLDVLYEGVKVMLKDTNKSQRKKGLNSFVALTNQMIKLKLVDKESKKWVTNLKVDSTRMLLNTPIDDPYVDVMQMSKAVNLLMDHQELPKTNPTLLKLTTTLCKKMAHKYLEAAKEQQYPVFEQEMNTGVAKALTHCTEHNNKNPNFALFQHVEFGAANTKAPTVNQAVITENYPDYDDPDEKTTENFSNMIVSTNNIINTTMAAAKITAISMAIGESPKNLTGDSVEIIVAKNEGRRLLKTLIQSHAVRVIPSQDWAGSNHSFDILMCTWSNDLMWWNQNHTHISTDIVNIEFWHSTCKDKINNFTKPIRLIFNVTSSSAFVIKKLNDSMTIPKKSSNKTIKVKRFTVPAGAIVKIKFYNLSEALNYVILEDQFPVRENFTNSSLITREKSLIEFTNNKSEPHWFYLGLLPLGNSSKNLVTYQFTSVIELCLKWNITTNEWQQSCRTVRNTNKSDQITCECTNLSIFAGYLQNIEAQSLELLQPEFQLELMANFVIFITLTVVLALYCLAITLIAPRPKLNVYFLGDNEKDELYAYLLLVTTGKSGTTSNVMIRIHGTNGSSQAHVLNYPDPEVRLLQRGNNDFFILTSEQFLGQLYRIEVWYDSSGYNPSWFCKGISIYDMQTRQKFHFDLNKHFSVAKNVSYIDLEEEEDDTKCKRIKICNDFHTWIFGNGYNFFFINRIHAILATILLIFLLNLTIVGLPKLEFYDCIDTFDRVHLDWNIICYALISGSVAFLIVLPISWTFRLSSVKCHKVAVLAWILLIIIICGCITMLVIFGFWIPYNVGIVWLIMSAVSILFVVFILENVAALLITPFVKPRSFEGIENKFPSILQAIESQRLNFYKRFGKYLLRPFFQHLYTPLDRQEIYVKKAVEKRRIAVIAELEDLVMFAVYIIILYLLVLWGKDEKLVLSNGHFKDMVEGMHTRSLSFTEISQGIQIYDYINETLIKVLQTSEWYENFVINDPGMMVDYNNKYLGVARLRQHRIERNSCESPKIMDFLKQTCWPEYDAIYADKGGIYGGSWKNKSDNFQKERLKDIWYYSGENDTGTLPVHGEIAVYSGGGYVAYLGRTLHNSYANFRIISKKIWIDSITRSVFIEFLAYNANDNIFNDVRLIFEQSASGYTSSDIKIRTMRMIFVEQDEVEQITVILFALFALWVFVLLVKYSIGIVKQFRTFYKDIWFLIDFVIIVMSFLCMAMLVIRVQMVKKYLHKLEGKKHNEFVPYGSLFFYETVSTVFAAVLVAVSTIRLWKFLRFGLMFRVFERTISLFLSELATAYLCWCILCLAFGLSSIFLFGNDFEEFSTIHYSMRLLLEWSLKTGIKLKKYTSSDMFFPYYTVYAVVVEIMLFFYTAIILNGYLKAKLEFSEKADVYNIKHYVKEQMRFLPKACVSQMKRLRGGVRIGRRIVPKEDSFRFANSVSAPAHRMRSMIIITKCFMKNMKQTAEETKQLSEDEIELMRKACGELLFDKPSAKSMLFYKGLYHGRKQIVDEDRIALMGKVVDILLQRPTLKERYLQGVQKKDKHVKCIKVNLSILRRCSVMLELMTKKLEACPDVF